MRQGTIVLLLIIAISIPGIASAVSEKDFEVRSTENIVNLCTASVDEPLYQQAINFCHGYFVGAYDYYEAESSGPKGIKLVCLPEQHPSRNEIIGMFVKWTETHPKFLKETPVETIFRFLMEKWPCKP